MESISEGRAGGGINGEDSIHTRKIIEGRRSQGGRVDIEEG